MKKNATNPLAAILLFVAPITFSACGNDNTATTDSTGTDTTTTMQNNTTPSSDTSAQMAVATLSGTKQDTTVSGSVRFTQNGNQTQMELQISVPAKANQSVAVHIHEHGDCGDMGKGAHGHWNPTSENHGKWGEGAFHSGDIGNINLDASGNATMQLSSDRWTVGGDAKTDVLNKAIIVHSGVDDYKSQPAGNAGERIGCGVIQRGNQ